MRLIIDSTYNHSLVIITFPKKEFEKLFDFDEFKKIVHDTYSFGDIIDFKKYANYLVFDIEIRKDETPFWYFSNIVKDAIKEEIQISGVSDKKTKITVQKGKIKTVLVDGKNITNSIFPDELIIDLIQYKLIRKT